MDLLTVLTASDDVQVSCSLSQTVSSIFPNLVKSSHSPKSFSNTLLMIFLTVSDDHESCSLSEMVSGIFPNLVKVLTLQITFQILYSLLLMIYLLFLVMTMSLAHCLRQQALCFQIW